MHKCHLVDFKELEAGSTESRGAEIMAKEVKKPEILRLKTVEQISPVGFAVKLFNILKDLVTMKYASYFYIFYPN